MLNDTESFLTKLIEICGRDFVFTDKDSLHPYSKDQTLDLSHSFDILLKPGSAEEISKILVLCNHLKVPVTPRGGGSGVTGGAIPVNGGIVLSLERLNKIIEINANDLIVIAESGVITQDLCVAAEQMDLFFPVPPSSRSFSFLGGNVAENAGSINSCKYGKTSDYVLNLEVVLPTGEIFWTSSNVEKNSSGLNITQLFVGSEGTLGVITKVVYKLLPASLVRSVATLLATFDSFADAIAFVVELKSSSLSPSAVELIGSKAIELTSNFLGKKDDLRTQILIELQAADNSILRYEMEILATILSRHTQTDILVGTTAMEREKLWKLRFNIGNALTYQGRIYRDIDACVPLSCLCKFITRAELICELYEIDYVYFGHVMDGNLHFMLSLEKERSQSVDVIDEAVTEIFKYAISIGGVLSGEHGIGFLQQPYMKLQYSNTNLQLMNRIKKIFDPNTILNYGKTF
ncbi:FAD-binding oxidoreductase [Mucilaginibacter sp. P25]|uniref:FAD-binding oxidoreductase n=1 Tax=Mucilaginibacter sp. P25 TaxID=3423945 RepID=UPI003D7BE12B